MWGGVSKSWTIGNYLSILAKKSPSQIKIGDISARISTTETVWMLIHVTTSGGYLDNEKNLNIGPANQYKSGCYLTQRWSIAALYFLDSANTWHLVSRFCSSKKIIKGNVATILILCEHLQNLRYVRLWENYERSLCVKYLQCNYRWLSLCLLIRSF